MEKTTIFGDYEKMTFEEDKIVEKEPTPMKIIVNRMPKKPEECIFSYGFDRGKITEYRCKLKESYRYCELYNCSNTCLLLESQKGHWTLHACGTTFDPCDCEYVCSKCGHVSELSYDTCPHCLNHMDKFDSTAIENLRAIALKNKASLEKMQQEVFGSLGISQEFLDSNKNKGD